MEFVTVNVGSYSVEMPTATTVKYAAKRVAEVYNESPELPWCLIDRNGNVIPDDDLIMDWASRILCLGLNE